jgi:hypothetical protein
MIDDIHITAEDQITTLCGEMLPPRADRKGIQAVRRFSTHPRDALKATCKGCRGTIAFDDDDLACIVTPADTKRELLAIEGKIAQRLNLTGTAEDIRAALRLHYGGDVVEDEDYHKWQELLAAHHWDIKWAEAHPEEKVNFDEPE